MRACRRQQRVAVRIGPHQLVDRDRAAGAGLGLDQHRLAGLLADLLPDDARDHIDAAARRERHEQPDRPAGKFRLGERGGRDRRSQDGEQRGQQRLQASASNPPNVSLAPRLLAVPKSTASARIGMSLVWLRSAQTQFRGSNDPQEAPKTSAATAGSASPTCARSATARGCARSATTPTIGSGKPVIGIINTWSEINPCHAHLRARAENVKRGVLQAGGFPIELPAMSLSETFVKPSTMLYRNFLAMETEELLRSHPIDGAVLMGGCDKTTPGLVMGAISMGIPAIYVPAGPMLRGNWHGEYLGSGSDVWKYWTEKRAGNITDERLGRDRGRHRALVRHLHGDGHRRDHDGDHRGARPGAARRVVDPGGRFQSSAHVRRRRPAHRRHGVGGSDAGQDPDAGRLRQRHQGAHGDGRLDQRHHPCGGDGAPRRHPDRHGDVRPAVARRFRCSPTCGRPANT